MIDDDEPQMGGARKGGLAAGLLAALGLGGLRVADNCAAAGARGMRAADDVAFAGSRVGGGLDDAARRGAGLEGAGLEGASGMRRPVMHPGIAAEEGLRLEDLAEYAADIGLELVSYEFDSDAPVPEHFAELVGDPLFINLGTDASAWARLAETGEGSEHAPLIVAGRAEGQALRVGPDAVPISELAATCWQWGTTCVFIGCEHSCGVSSEERLYVRSYPRDGKAIESYVGAFVGMRLASEPKPSFMAVAGGGPERAIKLLRTPSPPEPKKLP